MLYKWVVNFDPVDYMQSADAGSVGMMDTSEEAAFKEFSDKVLEELNLKKVNNKALGPLKFHKGMSRRQGERLGTARGSEVLSNRANVDFQP